MRISFTDALDDGRILHQIGRVRATSGWHAATSSASEETRKDAALRAQINEAREYDADAIVGVGFEIDDAAHLDLASIDLKRVAATGIAVRLARA